MLRRLTVPERDQLRADFLAAAAARWEAMFAPERQAELQTFAQREEQAVQVAQALGAQMLTQHLQADTLTTPAWPAHVPCPQCRQPAPAVPVGGAAPARDVRARVGPVAYPRPEYRCRPCRRSFFPGGPRVGARDRGL